jgi:RNA polymerase sigma-70 factor (ECF subfamily)
MSFSNAIDELTLAGLRRGQRGAQEAVYRSFSRDAWTLARRLSGCEAQAWDAVHGAFLQVYERVDQLHEAGHFGGWLRRIVINQVLDAQRKQARTEAALPEADPHTPDQEAALDLTRALDAMSVADRAVLWLHDAEGLTHIEIAEALGQSVPWSKTRLARARARMRRLLGPREAPVSTEPMKRAANHE